MARFRAIWVSWPGSATTCRFSGVDVAGHPHPAVLGGDVLVGSAG